MKNCNEIRDLLSFYLDNELHENERKQVVKHLEHCQECKYELEQLKNLIEQISEIEDVELPNDFNQKLHEKLVEIDPEKTIAKWNNKGKIFKWASAVVAGFVFLFIAVNNGYYNQLINSSKVAYVNDAELNINNKDLTGSISNQQAQEDSNEMKDKNVAVLPDITQKYTDVKTPKVNNGGTNKSSQTESLQNKQTEQNSSESVQNDTITALNETESSQPSVPQQDMPSSTSVILLVDNVSTSLSKVIDAVNNTGGTIEELSMFRTFSAEEQNNEKSYTVSIPVSSYNSLVSTLGQIGTVENTQQATAMMVPKSVPAEQGIQSAYDATSAKSVEEIAPMQDSQNIIINLSIKQK